MTLTLPGLVECRASFAHMACIPILYNSSRCVQELETQHAESKKAHDAALLSVQSRVGQLEKEVGTERKEVQQLETRLKELQQQLVLMEQQTGLIHNAAEVAAMQQR